MGREAGGASHDRISPTEFDSRSPFGDLRRPGLPTLLQAPLETNVPKADPGVHGILTALGGFSINELLPHLDWDLIAQNPKVFCGYSDITALQNAILGSTGLVTYSGPHWSTFGMRDHLETMLDWFSKARLSEEPFELHPSPSWTDDPWFLRPIPPNPESE